MPTHHRRRREVQLPDRMIMFLEGELTVDDLDEEEIMRGQLRNSAGDFRGRPSELLPRAFLDAIRVRRQQIWNEKMEGMVSEAWDSINSISKNPFPQPGDAARLAAARFIVERAQGKTPDNINIKAEVATWEKNLENSIVDVDWSDVGDDTKEIEQ